MKLSTQEITTVIDRASTRLAEYCMENNLHNTVTGVSGGLDSAVTIALSQKASYLAGQKGHQLNSLGLILPCHSDPDHAVLAKKVITQVGAELIEIDLTGVFDFVEKAVLKPVSDALTEYHTADNEVRYRSSQGNVKARLRMALGTYYVANQINGLVLSTDNYSELLMGFWTLHGDVGDFGMIQNLWKGTELLQVAQALEILPEIIDAAPTDGLGVSEGGDEAQLGAKYPEVDHILRTLMEHGIDLDGAMDQLKNLPTIDGIDPELVKKIAQRALGNSFKRHHPNNLSREDLGL